VRQELQKMGYKSKQKKNSGPINAILPTTNTNPLGRLQRYGEDYGIGW